MKPLRILILEDEPLIALDLETLVAAAAPSEVCWSPSIAKARQLIAEQIDFALLDIDVEDGKTFEFARLLNQNGTPFAFVSGSKVDEVPLELRHAAFIAKPYRAAEIGRVIAERAAMTRTRAHAPASNDNISTE
ncbi:response regulator [Terrarubrum flagellatum]|uniref:response regulator n=1 Tax=Terrirubrum flagellatum TaxID=2895980 RepID=UPI0031456FE2